VGAPLRVCFAREEAEKQGIASASGLGSPCFSEGSLLIVAHENTTQAPLPIDPIQQPLRLSYDKAS
jgi:hypothetical protein